MPREKQSNQKTEHVSNRRKEQDYAAISDGDEFKHTYYLREKEKSGRTGCIVLLRD